MIFCFGGQRIHLQCASLGECSHLTESVFLFSVFWKPLVDAAMFYLLSGIHLLKQFYAIMSSMEMVLLKKIGT